MATTPQTKNSALSFAEIKELIAFARAQKVVSLDVAGVRVQFSPAALFDDEPRKKPAKDEAEAPFGHYRPE